MTELSNHPGTSTLDGGDPDRPDVRTDVDVALRWGDMDANGHVNNVQVARLIEEARVRIVSGWVADLGTDQSFVVARQEVEFVASIAYDLRPAQVSVWASRIGGRSFDLACVLVDPRGTLSVRAETRLVAVDATGSVPLPDGFRAVLAGHLAPAPRFRSRD
ncbi:acyl-CoA thioesterase [Williamsia sterculiae]|uniref:Acyl-CoA thioester hydrolase n=1 Tax=Williamsia sterculiae TaxID=1344003 RepID=A0A1N7H2M6_9NOCA|nr:acyl-CoA thioesterase [Williamsia sterculiae]SIS19010.1 acyl-CoA thioester hydrolase [Williamsia sterculiae]